MSGVRCASRADDDGEIPRKAPSIPPQPSFAKGRSHQFIVAISKRD
jgi:hypothetical protein